MHFEDLDVPILAEASRRVLHQSGEQVNAQGCVTRLQNGNGLGGLIDERMMESLKAGRTDDDGLARPKTGVQMGLQRGWGGEVNQHVACSGERLLVRSDRQAAYSARNAGAVSAARQSLSCGRQCLGNGLSHATGCTVNADFHHVLKPSLCPCFMAVMEDIRSEEHTSELQSLMRISYAVFCLKK